MIEEFTRKSGNIDAGSNCTCGSRERWSGYDIDGRTSDRFRYHAIVVSFDVGDSRISGSCEGLWDEIIECNTISFPVGGEFIGIAVGRLGVGVFSGRSKRISGFLGKFGTIG